MAVFNPATVPGSYRGGPTNDAPVVTISSPLDGATPGSGTSISFADSASDTEGGDLTASLVWTSDKDGQIGTGGSFSTTLSDNNHTITATATDSGSESGSDSVSITVGDPPVSATTVSVTSVTYATDGGKNGDKHLLITVALEDNLGNAVSGATVSIDLSRNGAFYGAGAGTTGTGGTLTFMTKNAPSGCYTETLNVTHPDLTWDSVTPASLPTDPFCK